MWKDIHDAGFDDFTHFEFGKQILALFDFKCMDKISIKPASRPLNEIELKAVYEPPYTLEQIKANYPKEVF